MSAAAMVRAISGLAYPERFYAASTYAEFGGSSNSAANGVSPKFSNEVTLLLSALYQQKRKILCFRHEEFSSGTPNPESVEKVLLEEGHFFCLVSSEFGRSRVNGGLAEP